MSWSGPAESDHSNSTILAPPHGNDRKNADSSPAATEQIEAEWTAFAGRFAN